MLPQLGESAISGRYYGAEAVREAALPPLQDPI